MARGTRTIPETPAPARSLAWPEPTVTVLDGDHESLLDFRVVSGADAIRHLVEVEFASAPVIALDIETSQNRGYGTERGAPRTIQMAIDDPVAGRRQVIIDCFADDVSPVVDFLRSPDRVKVIHYSPFEQEWFAYHFGTTLPTVFDTCKAWQVIQRLRKKADPDYTSHDNKLTTLIEVLSGTPLAKEEQSSHWGRSDLTASQLRYAALDVAVLGPLAWMTRQIARDEGCLGDVDRAGVAVPGQVRKRLDGLLALPDDAPRVARLLQSARTREELDITWRAARQASIAYPRRAQLARLYNDRAEQLRLRPLAA